MLLGFKRRFAPYVENHSKTHSIRGERKRPPRVGETCHCYEDPRQKTMRLLGRWRCVKVERIEIREISRRSLSSTLPYGAHFRMSIEGEQLTLDECNELAWRDGFRTVGSDHFTDQSFDMMMRFWMLTHGNPRRKGLFRFTGHIIHWDPRASM